MFLSLNPRRDIIFAVAFKYRNFGLENNRSAVQFISDEVDGGTMLFIAVFQYLAVRMQAGIFWQ